jgi:hypothetical protein
LAEAIAKLETLCDSSAKRVVSLIEDLTELEALENAADLKAARDALAESEEPLAWAQVKAKVGCEIRSSLADELKNFSAALEMRSSMSDATQATLTGLNHLLLSKVAKLAIY